MKFYIVLAFLFACPRVYCQHLPQPVGQIEACRKFKSSIVKVSSDTMQGTGFIVDPNRWIITALHVVADQKTLIKYGDISVTLRGKSASLPASVVSPLDDVARARDFAILKIDKTNLPALDLGSEIDVEDGMPIVVIGLPLSAIFRVPVNPIPPFCLNGTIAAQTAFPLGNLQFVRTIYFQGISVKGISGAPIISLVSGKVIGVVSTRLTGLSDGLDDAKAGLGDRNAVMAFNGVDLPKTLVGLITTLDQQLANGLGSGTGASDVKDALKKAQHQHQRPAPK